MNYPLIALPRAPKTGKIKEKLMFKNFKIRTKLIIAMVAVTASISVFGFFIHQKTIEKNELSRLVLYHANMSEYALGMQLYLRDVIFSLEGAAMHINDLPAVKKNTERYEKAMVGLHKYSENFTRLKESYKDESRIPFNGEEGTREHEIKHNEGELIVSQIMDSHRRFMDLSKRFLNLAGEKKEEALALFNGEISPLVSKINKIMDRFVGIQQWEKEYHGVRLADLQRGLDKTILILIAASILFNFALIYLIFVPVFNLINKLSAAVRDIMAGNFSKRVKVESKDEIGQLAESFNKMSDSLLEAKRLPENILQSMKESLFVVDTKGNITEINRAALDALGYEKEELIGKPISEVFAGAFAGKEGKNGVIKYAPVEDL